MQMVKHRADPINAMILSKDGKTIDSNTITTTTRMRIRILNDWRMLSLTPFGGSVIALGGNPSPQRISTVATRGRELNGVSDLATHNSQRSTHFRGTLVMGMMAMNIIMQIDRDRGYSSVINMLLVISSRMPSPNMIQPITAIEQSSKNWHSKVRNNEIFPFIHILP